MPKGIASTFETIRLLAVGVAKVGDVRAYRPRYRGAKIA